MAHHVHSVYRDLIHSIKSFNLNVVPRTNREHTRHRSDWKRGKFSTNANDEMSTELFSHLSENVKIIFKRIKIFQRKIIMCLHLKWRISFLRIAKCVKIDITNMHRLSAAALAAEAAQINWHKCSMSARAFVDFYEIFDDWLLVDDKFISVRRWTY